MLDNNLQFLMALFSFLCSVIALYKAIIAPAVKFTQLQERIKILSEKLHSLDATTSLELSNFLNKVNDHDKLLERLLTLMEQNTCDIKELKCDVKKLTSNK